MENSVEKKSSENNIALYVFIGSVAVGLLAMIGYIIYAMFIA